MNAVEWRNDVHDGDGEGVAVETHASEGSVRRATGMDRDRWFELLDAWGAARRTHAEIAQWMIAVHGMSKWWARTLTADYEQARGLRPAGGSHDGTYSASVTTTVEAPVERLFQAFVKGELRERWLPGVPVRERAIEQGRFARFDWEDGESSVLVGFLARGPSRSRVALLHERLPHASAALEAKAYWRERLAALVALLEH